MTSIDKDVEKKEPLYIYTHIFIHNGTVLSHKKNTILPFETIWIDLEGIMLSKSDRERQVPYHVIAVICEM